MLPASPRVVVTASVQLEYASPVAKVGPYGERRGYGGAVKAVTRLSSCGSPPAAGVQERDQLPGSRWAALASSSAKRPPQLPSIEPPDASLPHGPVVSV